MANWYADRDHHPMGPELCPVQRRTPTTSQMINEIGNRASREVNRMAARYRSAMRQAAAAMLKAQARSRDDYTLAGPSGSDG